MQDTTLNSSHSPANLDARLVKLIETGFAKSQSKLSLDAQKQLEQKKDALLSAARVMVKENSAALSAVGDDRALEIVAGALNRNKAFLTENLSADRINEESHKLAVGIGKSLKTEATKVVDATKVVGAEVTQIEKAAKAAEVEAAKAAEVEAAKAAEKTKAAAIKPEAEAAKSPPGKPPVEKPKSKSGPASQTASPKRRASEMSNLEAQLNSANTMQAVEEVSFQYLSSPNVSVTTKAQISKFVFPLIAESLGKPDIGNCELNDVKMVMRGIKGATREVTDESVNRLSDPDFVSKAMTESMVNSFTARSTVATAPRIGELSPASTPAPGRGAGRRRATMTPA